MIAINRDFDAYLDEVDRITILLPYSYHNGTSTSFFFERQGETYPLKILERIELQEAVKYICCLQEPPQFGSISWVLDSNGGKTDLQVGAVIRTEAFDKMFYYSEEDLGVSYSRLKSTFKLWAPTATGVRLKLSSSDKRTTETFDMLRSDNGVWSLEIDKDLELFHYTFLVCVNLLWKETVDPYARAVSANGKSGIIINLDKTKRQKQKLPDFVDHTDAVIYETHIRDFTIHPNSGVKKKGKYLGFSEEGTCSASGKPTCLSYVKDLGITHLELLPVHDFEGVDELEPQKAYNWGYNSVHFNVPDGSYSSNPEDPYNRIDELKKMIEIIHRNGIRVILDVVYNHVYIREKSPLEITVPGYFFRHDLNGLPSNGTGVGNDIASERLMARKYIVDSVKYWLTEYQVDGFRFDLMGILDVETMTEVMKMVKCIEPSAIVIGEGWDLNTPLEADRKANIQNQSKLPMIGQFNDWFRDTVKGSTFNLYDKGFALGNERYLEAVKQVLAGSIGIDKREKGIFLQPIQSVNYVESHDNHTLWDKIQVCGEEESEEVKRKKHRLATAMVLLAQGIPFLHSGQEFFRTKKGIGNSYRSPDNINWLDWDRKDYYSENVNYMKELIKIRKSHKAFRLPGTYLIRKHLKFLSIQKPMIGYELLNVGEFGKWNHIIVIFNPSTINQVITLEEASSWYILANSQMAREEPIDHNSSNTFKVQPWGLLVAVK